MSRTANLFYMDKRKRGRELDKNLSLDSLSQSAYYGDCSPGVVEREARDMTTFGERLRELREAADMTQQELARRSGVNIYTLRGYEQGRREPYWRSVFDVAAGLGVSSEVFRDCYETVTPPGRGPGRPPKAEEPAGKKRRLKKGS
jgi:DNA-binding XRE family transcriptional regulator